MQELIDRLFAKDELKKLTTPATTPTKIDDAVLTKPASASGSSSNPSRPDSGADIPKKSS